MPTPAPYDALPDRLAALQQQGTAAYLRHAAHPNRGNDRAHLKLWAAAYEARAALAEQNPAFAQTLLPAGTAPAAPDGLPLVPAGIAWAVDQPGAPGTVTLTIDVAGGPGLSVLAPGATAPFRPAVLAGPTRSTCTFPAPLDGLYAVTLDLAGTKLATLYVPVTRAEFRLFRADSRAGHFAFRLAPARPCAAYVARLARLVAAEAAARCGDAPLALALLASARAVPAAPAPTALYPYSRADD